MADEPNKAKSIFWEALEKAGPNERLAYLEEACGGDALLRRRVEALLTAHEGNDQLLDRPAVDHLAADLPADSPEPLSDAEILDFLSPPQKPGSIGRLAHYEVMQVIGRGGMGIALRAFDEKLHRIVAIKLLSPHLATNSGARRRFVREAQAAAAVTHENVIAIHGVEDAGPVPYIVMQCIDGKTLQDKLDAGGPLELKEILRIGLQTAEGLAAAHRQGLIHRDVKPANILLENGIERVKITDFGLARAADDVSLTQSGCIAGTPLYMSPEQARDEAVDHRSDLFSLGSVLYAMCSGHPPFRASSSPAVLKRVCEETPHSLCEVNPSIPPWLQALVARLQAKDPADRFASAAEVATLLSRRLAQLQTVGVFSDVELPAAKPPRPQSRPASRLPLVASLSSAVVVLVGVSVAAWLIQAGWFADRPQAQANSEPDTSTPVADPTTPVADPTPALRAESVALRPARTLPGHADEVLSVAFSPNGKVLASSGKDRTILLWDVDTWQPRRIPAAHPGEVVALAFSPDNTKLASVTSASDSCAVRLWDVATGKPAGTGTLGGALGGMWGLAWSPDGTRVACGGWERTVHVYGVADGREVLPPIPDACTRFIRALAFSPTGDRIVTGGTGPTRLWDAKTGREIPSEFPQEDMCPSFLPGGDAVAGWMHGAGRVIVCDVPSGHVRANWRAHTGLIEGLAVGPDGRFLASLGKEGVAKVWTTDGPTWTTDSQTEVATLTGHQGSVFAAAFSPDGARLATTGIEDSTVRIWDLSPVYHVRQP